MQKLIYFFFLISCSLMAQNPTPEDIVGSYRLPSNDPQGGQSVIIFENNTFATFYFGGALKGKWEIVGNEVKFKTEANPKFYLYGRKLAALKDSTQLNFSCEENSTFVNLNSKANDIFQPLFNDAANCFSHPYTYKSTTQLRNVAFAKSDYGYGDLLDVYSFKIPEQYNDFIVIGLREEYTTETEFSASYKNGNLYFGGDKPASKKPDSVKETEENLAYLNEFMNKELLSEILNYGDEFFPYYDNPTKGQLTPFTRINPINKKKSEVKKGDTNLFTAKCEER
ncbi:hypothetical protein UMM65_10335 [Aureibaculum sp. 2210JD6-5]|uniref:hypothetical protein n=1 Tax=Aureibaculum sp. 2210JD6-5 TaxID=3103957 RepID=UPI002AAE685A|nr:hypothetical protein [Aureibaculum sp. 2210JD6-5]MDY7395640.1 hypothetical protein [Aureibaculum sp. 2210JD6-5]